MRNTDDPPLADRNWIARLKRAPWFSKYFKKRHAHEAALSLLLQQAETSQHLNHDTMKMIEGVLNVSEMKVRDIMVPRAQMVILDYNATPLMALPTIIESNHSRFPVILDHLDKVTGILLAKDLLQYTIQQKLDANPIKDIMRPATFIPESKRLDVLLKEFRLNRNHMAIVIDEYGNVSGLITIEDVLEQIVGNIEDETDITEPNRQIKKINMKEYHVDALTTLTTFNQYFHAHISDEDFDTIGGYVMQKFGHLPKPGESTSFDQFKVTVTLASERRIQLLCIRRTSMPTS